MNKQMSNGTNTWKGCSVDLIEIWSIQWYTLIIRTCGKVSIKLDSTIINPVVSDIFNRLMLEI